MKKKIEEMTAMELIDVMNRVCEYCANRNIEKGMTACCECMLNTCCTAVDGEPSDWDTYKLQDIVNTYIEEVEV